MVCPVKSYYLKNTDWETKQTFTWIQIVIKFSKRNSLDKILGNGRGCRVDATKKFFFPICVVEKIVNIKLGVGVS
jgi:hypothetical protein